MRFLRLPIAVLTLTMLAVPRPAHAWFAFLDYLSGPGPFKSGYPTSPQGLSGGQFDFTLLCLMPQPDRIDAVKAMDFAITLHAKRLKSRAAGDDALKQATLLFEERLNAALELVSKGDEKIIAKYRSWFTSDGAWLDTFADPGKANKIDTDPRAAMVTLSRVADAFALTWQDIADKRRGLGGAREEEVIHAFEQARSLSLEASVRTVAVAPGSILWARCADRPKNSGLTDSDSQVIQHRSRRPAPSIQFTYKRLYSNWDSEPNEFAQGKRITMQIFEPKISVPISGRFDFLDAQSGIGGYYFSSSGFDSFGGWIIEPIAFDWHLPSALADEKCGLRLLQGFSFHTGFVLFPGGIAAEKFGPGTPKISPGEAVFEMSVVYNVTRLWN
jgi:hypothetical protein